ncbi:cardiolipin synthase B, partial [Streptomyces sp. NPDC006289]
MTSHIDEKSTPSRSDDQLHTERAQRLRRRLERLIGIAATEGNDLVPLRNGDQIFAAMLGAIRGAEHTVDMMTFVY